MSKKDHLIRLSALHFLTACTTSLYADVVRDGTIGPNSSIQPQGPDFEISEELGELRGTNLFHSFREFSITSDQSATFTGTQPIDNIISRVTGASASHIDGLLSSTIPGADLYLLNPHGIVFGPAAQLDVKGAFHAGTGHELQFANGEALTANPTPPAILSIASPETFGFLGESAAPIELNGSILSSAHDIAFSAGTIALNDGAFIVTTSGIPEEAATPIKFKEGPWFGTRDISEHTENDARQESVQVNLSGNNIFSAMTTHSAEKGGDIQLNAQERISLSGLSNEGYGAGIRTHTFNEKEGGSISLNAPIVELKDGATGASISAGAGAGGALSIIASDRITISGNNLSGTEHEISGTSPGFATVAAASGDAGNVHIEAPVISLEDGPLVAAGSLASGNGGELNIVASERLTLSGTNNEGRGSLLTAGTRSTGDAGDINIAAPIIELRDGTNIFTGTGGAGAGGDLSIIASERLILSGADGGGGPTLLADVEDRTTSSIQASSGTLADGDGGNVFVSAPSISLYDRAAIRSSSQGLGNAGSVTVIAGNELQLHDGSAISTNSHAAAGGDITIHAGDVIHMRNSEISTSVESGTGQGGAINVDTKLLVLNDSQIIAQADTGSGGDIHIVADQVVQSTQSVINASSTRGMHGRITITDPDADIVNDQPAPSDDVFLEAQTFLSTHCEEPEQGQFNVAMQKGLPLSPEGLLLAFDYGEATPYPATIDSHLNTVAFRDQTADTTRRKDMRAFVATPAVNTPLYRGNALHTLARQYQADGYYEASLTILQTALTQAHTTGDNRGVAVALGQTSTAQLALGETQNAAQLLGEAIGHAEALDDNAILGILLNNLGNLHRVQQRHPEALNAYAASVQHAKHADDPLQQAKALSNGARAAYETDRYALALELLTTGRHLTHTLAAGQTKAAILIHLGKTGLLLAQTAPALDPTGFATAYTDLREAHLLSDALGDPRMASYALGNLGRLYQHQQRFEEALYLTRLAQYAAEHANAPESLYRWHWQEGQVHRARGNATAALDALRQAVAILEESRQETLAQYGAAHVHFRQAVAPVYMDLVDALLQRAAQPENEHDATPLLIEARATMEQLKAAELRDYFRDECVTELEAKTTRLEAVSADAAVIYPILFPHRLELLVSLPTGLQRYTVPVSMATLHQVIREFRTLVETVGPDAEIRNTGQALYRWLVEPYAHQLDDTRTLVFVPDGPLRTIPLAALHDGEDYLIRNHRVVITPGLALTDPRPLDRQAKFLLAGVSEPVQAFPALPAVDREIKSVQKLYGGRVLLNQAFTETQFEQALNTPVSVVHIASHAQFTGDAESSFLLTYDGRLSMSDLDHALGMTRFRKQPLELLVLSACQTAAGNERAALGLAGVGIKAGARSALGSLWSINDDAAATLITAFYRHLKDVDTSKAQALQNAQQALLADQRFAHPFYWSPYILINNWL